VPIGVLIIRSHRAKGGVAPRAGCDASHISEGRRRIRYRALQFSSAGRSKKICPHGRGIRQDTDEEGNGICWSRRGGIVRKACTVLQSFDAV